MKSIIQHLRNFFRSVQIHPLTLLYFCMAWMGGYLKWYLSALGLVCIHEICHLLMAYYFHFQIQKIEILPFGAYLSIDDFYFHPIIEEMCVVLAGPCCHFFLYLIINSFAYSVYRDYLLEMNMLILGFNMLPIYPLDGGRVIGLILQRFLDLKTALYFQLKLSVFALCILCVFYLRMNTVMIIGYLFVQQFLYKQSIPLQLRQIYSCIPTFHFSKVKVHHDFIYRRGYHNYYMRNQKLYDEKQMMFELMKTIEKNFS